MKSMFKINNNNKLSNYKKLWENLLKTPKLPRLTLVRLLIRLLGIYKKINNNNSNLVCKLEILISKNLFFIKIYKLKKL